jgi:hypothetical protein
MAALNKPKSSPQKTVKASPMAEPVRAIGDGHAIEPVPSPAHTLQKALHEAGYQSEAYRERPMSNAMLVMTLICVYALSMLMFFGSITA